MGMADQCLGHLFLLLEAESNAELDQPVAVSFDTEGVAVLETAAGQVLEAFTTAD